MDDRAQLVKAFATILTLTDSLLDELPMTPENLRARGLVERTRELLKRSNAAHAAS